MGAGYHENKFMPQWVGLTCHWIGPCENGEVDWILLFFSGPHLGRPCG